MVTGSAVVGPVWSITSSRVPKLVPYLRKTFPPTSTLARTLNRLRTAAHQVWKVGAPRLMPRPTIATSRPPGRRSFRACVIWADPVATTFLSPIRPAVWLNGGFISTTVGRTSRTLLICSASWIVTGSTPGRADSSAARRGLSSFTWTSAPAFTAWTARLPVPADGSSTTSLSPRFATHAAR